MKPIIKEMKTDEEILSTFPTVKQLRPHLTEYEYIEKINRLQASYGYHIVAVIDDKEVKAAAGYRITESLAWGKYFYLDDFITHEASRRNGYAGILWDWLIDQANVNNCEQFHLDSGVHRHDAHRFYLKGGLDITCHHFQMKLD
ncbi:Acetyltransferase (GNAT) family protein [Gracilibacillus ureilyticus]|uniref:Acetyltransferase (GNAT) family protein n=1 Tax=Gracilibacillus ureilyticus TaxID=531814 RepID=A0A1H9UHJ7_9BACI|nr:GNAT family N-acetyltransferase [Gracilibacillus ureilyticus]SES08738.1 Acetyltransferase (GNAT) family protein [Gracilibacillus ureilyticus]